MHVAHHLPDPTQGPRRTVTTPLTPLRPGDRVAVVAPAGPVQADRLAGGVAVLREWGLDVGEGPHVHDRDPQLRYLAGDDAARAADFRAAWLDPEITAVFCARGGYGAARMLQHLDVHELRAGPPKTLVGFSDITALHEVLADGSSGRVTVHGPVLHHDGQMGNDLSRERLRQLLFEPGSVTDLLAPIGAATMREGNAEGPLVGGNLSLLAASIGTPTSRPARGAVVVLEDTDEDAYQIDGLLTQLLRSGWFDDARGVVLGQFTPTKDPEQLESVLADRLMPLGVPMVRGAAVGHDDVNLALPIGATVALDAEAGTLTPRLS